MTSGGWPDAPPGFHRRSTARGALYAARDLEDRILLHGLDRGDVWERLLRTGSTGSGRGASAVLGGWRLKRFRRGGLTALLWRDRYPRASRLVDVLAASAEAARRGVPTPEAVALLVERDRGPLVRGYLATEEIEGAEDLARRAVRGAVTRRDVQEAMRAVRRMHDRGVVHPDLNLGNLLMTAAEVYVVDLDRVTFREGPVSERRRRRALRRIERSCAKLTGSPGLFGPGSETLWYEAYR